MRGEKVEMIYEQRWFTNSNVWVGLHIHVAVDSD